MVASYNESGIDVLIDKHIIENQNTRQGSVPRTIMEHGVRWPAGAGLRSREADVGLQAFFVH